MTAIIKLFYSLRSRIRKERRGMGSEFVRPTADQEARLKLFGPAAIIVRQLIHLADVSFWQGVIDFVKMKSAGISGVIIRAGQNTWADPRFKENWTKARSAGLPRGSYWFYDSRVDPGRQAELWWSLIQEDPGELVHVADFEESYGGAFNKPSHFKAFLQRFQQLSGLPDDRIAIYSNYYWWIERVGNDPWFRRYSFWLASYGPASSARIPEPWNTEDLLFWQYTPSGHGPTFGVSSQEIDLNWFCCDEYAWRARFPLASNPPPPPPDQGDPMPGYVYEITPLFPEGSAVRPAPHTANTKIQPGLPYGKKAHGNRKLTMIDDRWETINGVRTQVNAAGDVWLEVLEVNGQVLAQPAYVAEIHLGKRVATITQIGTPEPDPDPEPPQAITVDLEFDLTATIGGRQYRGTVQVEKVTLDPL